MSPLRAGAAVFVEHPLQHQVNAGANEGAGACHQYMILLFHPLPLSFHSSLLSLLQK